MIAGRGGLVRCSALLPRPAKGYASAYAERAGISFIGSKEFQHGAKHFFFRVQELPRIFRILVYQVSRRTAVRAGKIFW